MSMAGAKGLQVFRGFVLAASALLVASACLFSSGQTAVAQELIRRQNLFDRLFGGPPPREALPPAPRQQPRRAEPRPRRATPQNTRRDVPARAAPAEPVVEKLDNALPILVVGDFLASGLAEGLQEAYAKSPGVRIVDRSNGSSGFVRDDFYDWDEEIGPILDEVDPAVVIVMIGANDRQSLNIDGRSEPPQTERWREHYKERVDTFAETIETAGIPFIWTGLPPFESASMSSDMLAFNDIHKQSAEEAGGSFIDIWDGFVDENGDFTFTGPDLNGQPVRLRGSNGINLTRPAKRKVAFYVEQPLNKLLGDAASPGIGQQELEGLPPPGVALGTLADPQRTRPIALDSPVEIEEGRQLMGASPPPGTGVPQPANQPGRADDFVLRQSSEASGRKSDEKTTTAVGQ